VAPNPSIYRVPRVVLHHDERATAVSGADLQSSHYVGVTSEPTHRPLFPKEPLPILLIEDRGRDLYRHGSIQSMLSAPEDNSEPAPSDLLRVIEASRFQFRRHRDSHIAPGVARIIIDHRLPAFLLKTMTTRMLQSDVRIQARNCSEIQYCHCRQQK
jgi:hypothetical protein